MKDLTLRELQTKLPWSIRYSQDFRANPQPHKDFAHALTHASKAAGKLHGLVDDMDHRREEADSLDKKEWGKYLADLVICAIRMANTIPGGVLDLQEAVQNRIETKNGVSLSGRFCKICGLSEDRAKTPHCLDKFKLEHNFEGE